MPRPFICNKSGRADLWTCKFVTSKNPHFSFFKKPQVHKSAPVPVCEIIAESPNPADLLHRPQGPMSDPFSATAAALFPSDFYHRPRAGSGCATSFPQGETGRPVTVVGIYASNPRDTIICTHVNSCGRRATVF